MAAAPVKAAPAGGGSGPSSEELRAVFRAELAAALGDQAEGVAWEVVPELVDNIIKLELAKRK